MDQDVGDAVGDYEAAIAQLLRDRQQQPGMPSYRQLAELTGLSVPTVNRIFNAKRDATMTVGTLRLICNQLGLNLAELLDAADGATKA